MGPAGDEDKRLSRDLRSINRKLRDLQAAEPQPWPEAGTASDEGASPSLEVPGPEVERAAGPEPGGLRGRLARVRVQAAAGLPPGMAKTVTGGRGIEVLAPGQEQVLEDHGALWLVRRRAVGDPGAAPGLAAGLLRALEQGRGMELLGAGAGRPASPEGVVFFDLETTGLESVPLFLIGALGWEEGELVVHQFFARHYGEEKAAVAAFWEHLRGREALVSFNGATFDVPFLQARARVHRLAPALGVRHLDLLPHCRRIWRGALPNCKLQTLEEHICGRRRSGDIPGHLIPPAYHRYVEEGDAGEMVRVLEHNARDLYTLAELFVAVAAKG